MPGALIRFFKQFHQLEKHLDLVRNTTEGPVAGVYHPKTETISWKGIPYANPPVETLRWKAPLPPEKRLEPLVANTFSQLCPQYADLDRHPHNPTEVSGNEDCLYLNIWAPEKIDAPLPVFFWIHGGGNSVQWPLLSNLDAGYLAARGRMVVITFNYRVGPLGFLSHPALKTGDPESDSGNFALLDQIAALKWVRNNIAHFGGTKENITIAGESAGGQNVLCLLASDRARGLFSKAIVQSGILRSSTPEQGHAYTHTLLKNLLITDDTVSDLNDAEKKVAGMTPSEIAAYLYSKTPEELLKAHPENDSIGVKKFPMAFGDGHVLPEDLHKAFLSGNYSKVPLILGSNKDETRLFTMNAKPFDAWRKDRSLFKDASKASLYLAVNTFLSDAWKAMAVDELADIFTQHDDQPPVFTYQFLWGSQSSKGKTLSSPYDFLLGACHALEIDFVFGTRTASLGKIVFNEQNYEGQKSLSDAMMTYWTNFAATGDPNSSALFFWPAWTKKDGPKCLILDADLEKETLTVSSDKLLPKAVEDALAQDPLKEKILPFWKRSLYRRRRNQEKGYDKPK